MANISKIKKILTDTIFPHSGTDILFGGNIDLDENTLKKLVVEVVSSLPVAPADGRLVYLTTGTPGLYYRYSSTWYKVSVSTDLLFDSSGTPVSVIVRSNSNSTGGVGNLIGGYNNEGNGNYALIVGSSNVESGGYNVIGGLSNTVSALGNSVSGESNTVSGRYNKVSGKSNIVNKQNCDIAGQLCKSIWNYGRHLSSGAISTSDVAGSSQYVEAHLNVATVSDTSAEVLIDSKGDTFYLDVPSGATITFQVILTGVSASPASTSDNSVVFDFKGTIRNIEGSTSLVDSGVVFYKKETISAADYYVGVLKTDTVFGAANHYFQADTSYTSCECLVLADDTNNRLKIQVKGVSDINMNWSGIIKAVMVATNNYS